VTLTVELLARYPVKALGGESIEVLELDERGVVGDRAWAVRAENGKLGSAKSDERFTCLPRLLEMSSRVMWGIHTVVALPDGREYATTDPKVHDAVSEVVGQPVTLVQESSVRHLNDSPLLLVTVSSLRWLADQTGVTEIDWMSTRTNILVAGEERDDWIGKRVDIGTAEVEITGPATCRVMSHADERKLGVYARVSRPGVIGTGDPLRVC
jgi:uncharacterized protein YcbX